MFSCKSILAEELRGSSSASRFFLVACTVLLISSAAAAQPREDVKIEWRGYTFYTDQPLPPTSRALTLDAVPADEEGYFFVQFTGPITAEIKEQASAAGAELLVYVPNNAYVARMTGAERGRVEALAVVRWVGIYQPAMRLSRPLAGRLAGQPPPPPPPPPVLQFEKETPPPAAAAPEPAKLRLTVLLFPGVDVERLKRDVEDAGGTVTVEIENPYRPKLRVVIPEEGMTDLARVSGVMWIEEHKLPRLFNDTGRGVMSVEPVWTGPGLRGGGQVIGIADTGLDSGVNDASMHDDFEGPRIVNIVSLPVQPGTGALNVGADDGASDLNGHGTHVAGSAVGDGSTLAGAVYSGTAPEASLFFQAVEQFTDFPPSPDFPDGLYLTGIPGDLNDLFQPAYDAGARVHSDSWGDDDAGAYSVLSEEVDQFVWEHPDLVIVFAAGNEGVDIDADDLIDEGSVGSPGTCKNCLTVGASENDRPAIPDQWNGGYTPLIRDDQVADAPGGMAAFSSRGPTDANRIKPDVVAPGTMIVSTRTRATANTVFRRDDMESGVGLWTPDAPWTRVATTSHSATTSWHDSPAGNYANNVDVSLTWDPIDVSAGGSDKFLRLWTRSDLGSGDGWSIEVSDPIVGSGSAGPFNGSEPNWRPLIVGLGPWATASNLQVSVRLTSDNDGSTGDGLYIDDVQIVEGTFGFGLPSDYALAPAGGAEDANYMFLGGTSMATPLTAGAAALTRQYYADELHLGFVSAALVRATLIAGAADITPGQYGGITEVPPRPNNVEGWGRVDLANTLFPAAPTVLDHVDELAGLGPGDMRTYDLEVTDASVPVIVTMVYHDFPGPSIVNQLDLSVETPAAVTLHPNGLAGPDLLNNVEQIVIPAPILGTYTITVDAPNVPEGPQPYALVTRAGGSLVHREPVDVMLVLDYSASMWSPACPTCAPKHEVLKDAVEIFVQLWTALAVPDDRLGVTYFRTDVSDFDVAGDVLLPVVANAPGIITDVRNQDPSDNTVMGGGLQSAINRLTDAARPRSIVLFTDGMQNVNPRVLEIDDSPPPDAFHLEIDDRFGIDESNIDPTVPPTVLDTALDRSINTIGVGSTPAFSSLLTKIAAKTDGVTHLTTAPDEDLRRFFVEELVDVLRDFSPQLIAYRHGTLGEGGAAETFTVNRGARQLVLKLSGQRGDQLGFRVEKDGADVSRLGHFIHGPFYSIFSIDLPASSHGAAVEAEGDWLMRIGGVAGAAYQVAAIADEPQLGYEFSVGGAVHQVAEPLDLAVRLSLDGAPLPGATRVSARVLRPGAGVGTLLATTATPDLDGLVTEGAATAGQRKLQILLQDSAFYRRLRPTGLRVNLADNGDGTYTGHFDDTVVPGSYQVVFEVEGEHPAVGKFRRTETRSTLVEFGRADFRDSDVRIVRRDPSGDGKGFYLLVRPRDSYGNFLGLDYAHRIVVTTSEGSVGPARDLLDGSYELPLLVPPGSDPQVRLEVMGEPLLDRPLSKIPGSGGRWSLSLHLGRGYPVGDFDTFFDPDSLIEIDVERQIRPRWSLRGVAGRYGFDPSFDVDGLTISARRYWPRPWGRLFAEFGPGYYDPDFLDASLGLSLGYGADRPLTPRLRGELGADYIRIFNDGDDIEFIAFKAGISYSF